MIAISDTVHILPKQGETVIKADTRHTAPGTGDSVPEYWVTRVVRQMKGCSPSKIDSVIQANLPSRRIRWSQRPDTLEIPGLEGRQAYSVNSLTPCYELGFFKDNALLHPEITVRPQGIPVETTASYARHDDILSSAIIACFLLLSIILHHTRPFLSLQAQDFFKDSKPSDAHAEAQTTVNAWHVILTNILLASIFSILFLYYAQDKYNLFLCHFPKHYLLGIYIGTWLSVFTLKRIASGFINWIFFDKTCRQQWRSSYNFLLILETVIMLPSVAFGIYFNLSPDILLYLAVFIISLFKLTLLYKTYTTFLFKFYCILHLLSYLCALEITPLLATWAILTGITDCLTLIF